METQDPDDRDPAEQDPTFKQALKETLLEMWASFLGLWWLLLIALIVILFLAWLMWFLSNYGPGAIYRRIGEGEYP